MHGDFEEKLARLSAEELTPLGLELLVRELDGGITRYLIKETRSSHVCEMIDCRTVRPGGNQLQPAGPIRESEAVPWRGWAPAG